MSKVIQNFKCHVLSGENTSFPNGAAPYEQMATADAHHSLWYLYLFAVVSAFEIGSVHPTLTGESCFNLTGLKIFRIICLTAKFGFGSHFPSYVANTNDRE